MISRLLLAFDAVVDILMVAGCQGTKPEILEKLAARFSKKMTNLATLAVRLNEVIGEKITSCELKAISMPNGTIFDARTMDNGYDDGRWHGLSPGATKVLCTTELGLQKEIKVFNNGKAVWQRVVLVKPQVSLESVISGMHRRDVGT
jgi:hypothetical protein